MKIGFYLNWNVGSLDSKNKGNVLGEEILATSIAKYLSRLEGVEYARVYASNYLPEEKLDVMIYMNDISTTRPEFAKKNVCYVQNCFNLDGDPAHALEFIKNGHYDGVLTYSRKVMDFIGDKYKIAYVPFGVDTEIYKPLPYDKNFDFDVAFVGNNFKGEKRTKMFLEPALSFNFGLFGNWKIENTAGHFKTNIKRLFKDFNIYNIICFPRYKKRGIFEKLSDVSRGRIAQEDMMKLLSSSKVLINYNQDGAVFFDVMSYRILEILACKGFVITDDVPIVRKELKDCVVITKGGRDMRKKINYYLKHPEMRAEYAQKGYEYVQKYGSMEARATKIYEFIKEL